MGCVDFAESDVYVEAFIEFGCLIFWCEDDTDGQYVVYFLEGDVLGLHLAPDGVWGLDALDDFVVESHLVELATYRSCEAVEYYVALGLGVAGIFIGTATDECIRGLIVMYYWYKKKWLGKSVIDKTDVLLE